MLCVKSAACTYLKMTSIQEKVIMTQLSISGKVEIFLEQREILSFSTVHLLKFRFSQILLGDKNATYLCSKIISTLYKSFQKSKLLS